MEQSDGRLKNINSESADVYVLKKILLIKILTETDS